MRESEEDSSVDAGEDSYVLHYRKKKKGVLCLLLLYSAVVGAIYCFRQEESATFDFITSLPIFVLTIVWCFNDAAEREHRIGRPMQLLFLFFFIIALPIYLFQTRGVGAFKSLGLTLLFVAAMFACMYLTGLVMLCVSYMIHGP